MRYVIGVQNKERYDHSDQPISIDAHELSGCVNERSMPVTSMSFQAFNAVVDRIL